MFDFTLLSRKKLPFWEILLIVYLLTVYLIPSASIGSTVLLLLLLAYCAYIVFVDPKMFSPVIIPLLLIVFLAAAYAMLTDASSIAEDVSNRELKRFISKTYQYVTLYFPAILFVRISRIATPTQKKLFSGVGIIMMVYVVITTWLFLQENSNATRHWEDFSENAELDIANYYFVYAVPIIISAISIFMLKYRGFIRYLSLTLVVVGLIFLVNAQYTLAILIAIIGVLFQVFRHIKTTLYKAIFLLVIVAMFVFLPQILTLAIRALPIGHISVRLTEIRAFLTGQGADGYNLNSRLTLYGDTLLAFFRSPVWGNRRLDFDGHATFLTVLSDTGIIGGVPFYALLVVICKQIQRYMGSHKQQFGVIIMMFVMMGLTNPVHASLPLGFVTWFLAPLTIQIFLKEDPQYVQALEN